MPLYEYQCDACGHIFELIQKFSDAHPSTCPSCGAPGVRKLLSSPAIQFKGSGWYITDYARKGGSEAARSDAAATAASGGASESKGDGKAETKSSETKSTETRSSETKPASGGGSTSDS